jgi:hypothetical protein
MMLCDKNMAFSSENPNQHGVVLVATESQINASKFLEQVGYRIRIPVTARISVDTLLGKGPCDGLHPQAKSPTLV